MRTEDEESERGHVARCQPCPLGHGQLTGVLRTGAAGRAMRTDAQADTYGARLQVEAHELVAVVLDVV